MPEDRGKLREIAWWDVFPWLHLFSAVRCAAQFRMLALGALGLLLTVWGWRGLAYVFSGSSDPWLKAAVESYSEPPHSFAVPSSKSTAREAELAAAGADDVPVSSAGFPGLGDAVLGPYLSTWQKLSAPFRHVFENEITIASLAFVLACAIWASIVWGLCGGAATRIAVMQIGRDQKIALRPALAFARKKWFQYLISPLFPLVLLAIASAPMAFAGLLMRSDVGAALMAVLWPLMLVGGLLMAIVAIGLAAGWPLMFPTISAEGLDSFDALSRSYAYVYQRPFHLAFYVGMASLIGAAAMQVVGIFAHAVVYLPQWAASWGTGGERMAEILAKRDDSTLGVFAGGALSFWSEAVGVLAEGFAYSYFWAASSVAYLLLRWHVDGHSLEEVFVEDSADAQPLPPLETSPVTPAAAAPAPETESSEEPPLAQGELGE